MRGIVLLSAVVVSTITWSQPNELVLEDTLLATSMEPVEFLDLEMFYENFDTTYNDQHLAIYESSDSWAGKSYLHLNTDEITLFYLILDPDMNTGIDSVQYYDLTQDGNNEAFIFYSRTDGTSGQSGGFSDNGRSVMVIDMANSLTLLDIEYSAFYESYSQEYDEVNDEYINTSYECLGHHSKFYFCEGIIYLIETQRGCEEAEARFFYYEWNGENLVQKPWGIKNGNPCH